MKALSSWVCTRMVVGPWFVTRAAVVMVALSATCAVGFDPLPVEQAAWRVSANVIGNLPARWDAYWYLDIATNGYRWDPADPFQQNVVFFPAYPLAIRAVHGALGIPMLWGGVLLSLIAFAWALLQFARVATRAIGDEAAPAAVWLMAAYPFAIFYSAVYTESLFLLALLGAWRASEERRAGATAAWGMLLGLARPNGCLMSLPLAWLWWDARRFDEGRRARWPPGLAAAAAPVGGAALYSAFLWWRFGDPLAWVKGQQAWGSLWHGLATPGDPRWGPAHAGRWSDVLVYAGNGLAAASALALVVPIWRRFSAAAALVVALNVLPPLAAHGVLSLGRFTSVLFPVFLWLSVRIGRDRRARWIAGFLLGQLAAAALHYSWRIMT